MRIMRAACRAYKHERPTTTMTMRKTELAGGH